MEKKLIKVHTTRFFHGKILQSQISRGSEWPLLPCHDGRPCLYVRMRQWRAKIRIKRIKRDNGGGSGECGGGNKMYVAEAAAASRRIRRARARFRP